MTEYDYSPEAYQRHIDTQNRIARWIDNTNSHAYEFRHPFGTRSDLPSPKPRDHHGRTSSREIGSGYGSKASVNGSGSTTKRRNSISYQPKGITTQGPTSTLFNRQTYPYPLPCSQIPIPPAPAAPPPKPIPVYDAKNVQHTRTHTRPRSLSQSYVPSPTLGTTLQRRDSHSHRHSQSHSRSNTPHRSYARINPNTANTPTRSGTYPVYISKPPQPPASHVKSHSRDRSYSLSQTRPTSRASVLPTPQRIIPPTNSGVTSPASSSRTAFTVSKPVNVGGYTIIPRGRDIRVIR